jgi:hypothetical protein
MSNKAVFKYIQDPGHGWLEVPRNLLTKLGIEYDITAYSYIDRSRAYLEEDCDMSLFLKAFKDQVGEYELKEVHVNHDSFIRNLKPYPMTRPEVAL